MTNCKVVAALVGLGLALPVVALAQDQPLEEQLVNAMNKVFGVHPGFRANHAKGIVVEGSFKASPEAAGLSRAALFSGATIPVTVRSDTDIVINSFKFFPVSTGEEFRDLLLALADSPPNATKPTKFEQFAASHPSVPAAFSTVATPDSFADEEYYGIDAFVFVNKAGERQAVRYQMLPENVVHLDKSDAAKRAPDFLMEELPERLKRGPVTFHYKAQLAAADDSTKDPAKPWPDNRKVVELGVLTIDRAAANSVEAPKRLLFLPGQLTDGIEQSDDPMLDVRNAAYAISFSRRNP